MSASSLAPCPSCHRHVRGGEGRCPFCGEVIETRTPARLPAASAPPRGRLSRAAALAIGASLAAVPACGRDDVESVDAEITVDAAAGDSSDAAAEARPDRGLLVAGDARPDFVPIPVYGASPPPR
jgi:hypothetical protein